MFLRMLVLALCCSLLSCKDLVQKYKTSNTGISALNRKVLYDFRSPVPTSNPSVDEKVQRLVFSFIPPASCPVAATQPRPSMRIASVATGSFTYAAEPETAYLVTALPCGWPNKLVIVSAGKVQAAADTSFSAIAGTFDLNHDDKNELLLVGENTHNGEIAHEASLDTFEKNSLRAAEDFGIVYHESCALFAGVDEAKKKAMIASGLTPHTEAVVVYYLPHSGLEMPNFTAERYRAPCPGNPSTPPTSKWQLVSR